MQMMTREAISVMTDPVREEVRGQLREGVCRIAHGAGLPYIDDGHTPDAVADYLMDVLAAIRDVQLGHMAPDEAIEWTVTPGLLATTERCTRAGAAHWVGAATAAHVATAIRFVVEKSLKHLVNSWRRAQAARARAEAAEAFYDAMSKEFARARETMNTRCEALLTSRAQAMSRLDALGADTTHEAFDDALKQISDAFGLPRRFASSKTYEEWLFGSDETVTLGEF